MPTVERSQPEVTAMRRAARAATRGPGLKDLGIQGSLGAWRFVSYWWLTALVLGIWQAVAYWHHSPFFPPFLRIFERMVHLWFSGPVDHLFVTTQFNDDLGTSAQRLAEGWGLAVAIGVLAGIALGSWRHLAAFFGPLMRFSMSVPVTAVLPIAVVLFGINNRMNVFLIAFGTVWTVLVHTMDGVQGADEATLLAARSLRLGPTRHFFSVLLPAASPRIFAGLRVSVGIAVVLMVISELFAATNGIGYFLVYSQKTFAYLNMWAAILIIGLLGIALNGAFSLVERRVLSWYIGQQRHIGGR